MRIEMNIPLGIASFALMAALSGCAGVGPSPKGGDLVEQAKASVLQDVRISGEGKRTLVAIATDRPVAYTFYMSENPTMAVVDLAQVDPGAVHFPLEVNKGAVRKIEAVRQGEGGTAMTRLELSLTKGADVTAAPDPRDKRTLLVTVTAAEEVPPVATATPAAEAKVDTQLALVETKPAVASAPAAATPAPAETSAAPAEGTKQHAAPAQSGVSTVTAITFGDNTLEIRVSGGVTEYKSFRLSKPDRLVVDIMGAKAGIEAKVIPLDSLGVGTARIGAYPEKVRIVFDSARGPLPQLSVEKSEAGLKIVPVAGAPEMPKVVQVAPRAPSVSKPEEEAVSPSATKAEPAPRVAKQPEVKHAAREHAAVESIDFRVDNGVSRLLVSVSGGCDAEKPVRTADGLALTLKNCTLPVKWQRFLDTGAFASVVQKVTPYQVKTKGRSDVKVQVKMRQSVPFELSRRGDVIALEIKNPAGLESAAVEKELAVPAGQAMPVTAEAKPTQKVYTGRRITLEFSDADIRKIFQLIAEVSNLNFLVGDDVTGTISIKLVNVPWDQALDVILENKGLGMQREGNIVQIRPKSKIQTLADEEQAMRKAKEKAMELETKVFDINYANVSDVVTQFNALKSDRGTITQDARTNRVIVKDIAPNIEDMKFLLKNLDLPERQVMIEARIVEASSDFTRDIGVQWGLHTDKSSGSTNVLGISNADAGFGGILSGTAGSTGTFGPGLATGITFGKIISGGTLDLKLSAAATTGQVKIISTPKV
uniref:type IV pilus secretin family protein n=1 Tax=Geobacter sp. TaxID=46610 RepID=UPI0026377E48